MPQRNVVFANDEIYHIYNKSVANEDIFSRKRDLAITLDSIDYYRFPQSMRLSQYKQLPPDRQILFEESFRRKFPLVDIYAYCLMPNHYHLLLKQLQNDGIKKFISNFQISMARYYNLKYERRGSLLLHPFKAKRIESEEVFIHVSRYIHLNPVTSFLMELQELENCYGNSFRLYSNNITNSFVNTEPLLAFFKTPAKYKKFVFDQAGYQRKLFLIKHLTFE